MTSRNSGESWSFWWVMFVCFLVGGAFGFVLGGSCMAEGSTEHWSNINKYSALADSRLHQAIDILQKAQEVQHEWDASFDNLILKIRIWNKLHPELKVELATPPEVSR